jgi:hypothetical protein
MFSLSSSVQATTKIALAQADTFVCKRIEQILTLRAVLA